MGRDLRLLVANGEVVGAVDRMAAAGEWRTNVSLGGTARPVAPAADACIVAVAAATAPGADFVGVDLFPSSHGWIVLELNGSVDFHEGYSLSGRDVYGDLAGRSRATVPSGCGPRSARLLVASSTERK